jgi:hypothetical protein
MMENKLKTLKIDDEIYLEAKKLGFLDRTIESLSGAKIEKPLYAL